MGSRCRHAKTSVSHSHACVALPWFVRMLVLLWTLIFGFRIGEASKPGPGLANSVDRVWSIGRCNPSGLHGKQRLVHDLNVDILAISETHLTGRGSELFRAGMHGLGSEATYLTTGAPLESRVWGSDAGSFSGVAVLSKHPSRALCMNWPQDVYETSRLQFCTSFVHSVWVTGAVCYGYPTGKLHVNARERTDALLTIGFERLLQAAGPRYFAGDWNHTQSQLEVIGLLQSHGWCEIQDLEAQRCGYVPSVTCKGATRKDFLYVSPELAQWFVGIALDDNVFPDHSVLVGYFQGGVRSLDRFVWPTPAPVDWAVVAPMDFEVDFSQGDPTQLYQGLWAHREFQAQSTPQWTRRMGGRASQTKPRKRVGWPAPLRPGRSNDFQPQFLGCDVQHTRWVKQLRRLHNYVRWARNRTHSDMDHHEHGCHLWRSILQAPGFIPSFVDWWPQRSMVCVGDPAVLPLHLPPLSVAEVALVAFHHEVRTFEALLTRSRQQQTTLAHAKNPNLDYRGVKRSQPEPVSTLLESVQAKVIALDFDDSSLVLDQPVQFDAAKPVFAAGVPLQVIHAEADKIWVESFEGLCAPSQVVQSTYRGSLPEVFHAFHEQWKQRWCRHDTLPHTHWAEILQFASVHMRQPPVPHMPVDADMIQAEAQRKKPFAATGLDGVSRQDLLQACPKTLQSICSLYARAEASGFWPKQIVAGKVNSLAKTVGAKSVNDYRPIVVYSLVYRLWSSLQARRQLAFADQWAHPELFGNRRGKHAAHLWRALLHEIETCRVSGVPLSGLCCDIEKAFNCLPRWPVLVAAMYAGTPNPVLNAWSGSLAMMCRHFKCRDSLSEGFLTSTGLAEGCALSCYGMLLVDHMLHGWLHELNPQIRVMSYVDDWTFVTRDQTHALAQLDAALQFCRLCDLTLDLRKTFAWSVDPGVRQQLRRSGLCVRHFARDLGAHIAFSKQFTNCTIRDRFDSLNQFWDRLKTSRCSYTRKTFLLRMVGLPRGLYGISSAPFGLSTWVAVRRKACAALSMRKAGVNPLVLLGLVEKLSDPQLVGSVMTFRDAREFVSDDHWNELVMPFAMGLLDLSPNAPSCILVHRLVTLGFRVAWGGVVHDQLGSLLFLHGNFC